MSDHVLRLDQATKIYRTGDHQVRAVDEVTLAFTKATVDAIIGPSGSGKSTLLNLMGALDTPTAGEVYIDGVALSGLDEAALTVIRRDRVGFVFQQFHLIPNLSAAENVELPMEFARQPAHTRRERARMLLDQVGLAHRADHRPGRLSGGEQQRVAIARALANDPALILADEPTGNLDRATGDDIVALLHRLAADQGTTVVVVTHDEYLADAAHQRWHIEDGRIRETLDGSYPDDGQVRGQQLRKSGG
jgi:putative ABC transport system ATP-binding protein